MEHIAANIFVETKYEGVNVGAIFTNSGIICIDVPSYPREARHWAAELQKRSSAPIRYVILTDSHGDRIINTRWFNAPIVMHQLAAETLRSYERRYPQKLLDSLIKRNPLYGRELSHYPVGRPTISFTDEMRICLDGQMIKLMHVPGPTAGNSWVYFPEEQLLFAGDSVVVDHHPCLVDAQHDCWIENLEWLLKALDVQRIVPGRGPLSDKMGVQPVIDYVKLSRTFVDECIQQQLPQMMLAKYTPELIAHFPLPSSEEWLQEQIMIGLLQLYHKEQRSGAQEVS